MGSSFDLRIWGRSYRRAAGQFRFPEIGVFTGWRNRPGRGPLVGGILLVMPGLLFLPALHYTLTTPFALIDDYAAAALLAPILDSREQFFRFLTDLTILEGYPRHRPFYEFYNAASWHVFGPVPWLHHLARWVMHFGAILAFVAALLRFMPSRGKDNVGGGGRNIVRLLPLALLAYLWIFFPNQPAARLGPQEVYTVLFLGLCNWMMALLILRAVEGEESLRSALLAHGLFYLGCLGLAWSKEVNVAPLLWLAACYYGVLLIDAARQARRERLPLQVGESRFAGAVRMLQRVNRWKALGGLLLLLLFGHTLYEALTGYAQGGHGIARLTPELLISNARWIYNGLFQTETSPVITVGLTLLGLPLAGFVVSRAIGASIRGRKQSSGEFIFALFLLGQFAVLYLAVCTSAGQAMRYWYIIIPAFTTLLAFSAKLALEFLEDSRLAKYSRGPLRVVPPRLLAVWVLSGFIVFFIGCNYYNFLYQTAVQHSIRNDEAELLAAVADLHNRGEYVQTPREPERYGEALGGIIEYFDSFRPRFYGGEYEIGREPPEEHERPYYIVRPVHKYDDSLTAEYRFLSWARDVSMVFQSGEPYRVRDGTVDVVRWDIYHSAGDWSVEGTGEPALRDDWEVYRNGKQLIYAKHPCGPGDIALPFFLHTTPVDYNDLTEGRRQYGFDNLDFEFADSGVVDKGRCRAMAELPDYAIKEVSTGQYDIGVGRIWSRSFGAEGLR